MSTGYVIHNRSIPHFPDKRDHFMLRYLIDIAAHTNHQSGNTILERGQAKTTYPALAERTIWTEKEWRGGLYRLERAGEIARHATNKFTVISITYYSHYTSTQIDGADKRADKFTITGADKKSPVKAFKKADKEESQHVDITDINSNNPHNTGTQKGRQENTSQGRQETGGTGRQPGSLPIYSKELRELEIKTHPTLPAEAEPPSSDPPTLEDEGVFEFQNEKREERREVAAANSVFWKVPGMAVLENHNRITGREFDGTQLRHCSAAIRRLMTEKRMSAEEAIKHCGEIAKWRTYLVVEQGLTAIPLAPESVYSKRTMAEGGALVIASGGKFIAPEKKTFQKAAEPERKILWPCADGRSQHGNESSSRSCLICHPVEISHSSRKSLREILNETKVTEH